MEKCNKLYEYDAFVQIVKDNERQNIPLHESITMAVDEAVNQNILRDILTNNRAEVIDMVLTEYDEQRHIASEKNLSYEEVLIRK